MCVKEAYFPGLRAASQSQLRFSTFRQALEMPLSSPISTSVKKGKRLVNDAWAFYVHGSFFLNNRERKNEKDKDTS